MRLALAVLLAAGLLASCGVDDTVEPRPLAAAPSTSPSSTSTSSSVPPETTTTTAAPIPPPAPTTPVTPRLPSRPSRSSAGARTAAPAESHSVDGWRSLGVFESTCYDLRGTTASGRPAGPGSIAVDPRVIALGTRLRVEGYGEGIAADTGGAIKGRIVDVWKSSGCREWGRRRVEVFVADG